MSSDTHTKEFSQNWVNSRENKRKITNRVLHTREPKSFGNMKPSSNHIHIKQKSTTHVTGKSKAWSSFRHGSASCSNDTVTNLFLFHHLILPPYSVLVLLSDKIFLPGRKAPVALNLHWPFPRHPKNKMSISQKSCQIPKGLLRVLLGSLADGEAWPYDWQSHKECGRGRSQGKEAFIRRKENGDWVVEGRCPPGSANSSHFEPKSLAGAFGTH